MAGASLAILLLIGVPVVGCGFFDTGDAEGGECRADETLVCDDLGCFCELAAPGPETVTQQPADAPQDAVRSASWWNNPQPLMPDGRCLDATQTFDIQRERPVEYCVYADRSIYFRFTVGPSGTFQVQADPQRTLWVRPLEPKRGDEVLILTGKADEVYQWNGEPGSVVKLKMSVGLNPAGKTARVVFIVR